MTDRQQRIHWVVSHLADLLVIVLLVAVALRLGGAL